MPATSPPWWRDPWSWTTAAAALLLVLTARGAPLGVPAAEDFDFLRRALLEPGFSLLDGGGSLSFWRPLAHQIYYRAMGPLILTAPHLVAALHALVLAAGGLLVYRALRPSWSGWAAAAAATFALLAESTRTLVAWPTQFVDLGLFFFSALALHERSRRRLFPALAALLAALLCKEVAVATGVLLAWWPDAGTSRRERWTWAASTAVLIAAWAALYFWVRAHSGLTLPHALETDLGVLHTPLAQRLWWGAWNSLRSVASLALAPGRWDLAAGILTALLAALALVTAARGAARERLARAAPWAIFGLAWFALASASLAAIFPLWQPNRAQFGSVGLGIAAVAMLEVAGPALVAGLVALRLALLLIAPGAPAVITPEPVVNGAFMDFGRLARLQLLMEQSRHALRARHPALPHGAAIGFRDLPLSTEYAFGGPHAVQVWYRDTTLRWVSSEAIESDSVRAAAVIEFQPGRTPQVVIVEPAALRWKRIGIERLQAGAWSGALDALGHADSAQRDRGAAVLLGELAGRRALALAHLGRLAEAADQARFAVSVAREDLDARYVLAFAEISGGNGAGPPSRAQLDTLLAIAPDHAGGRSLAAQLEARKRTRTGGN